LVHQERNSLSSLDKIFRAYDIRGTYPEQINKKVFYDLGRTLGTTIKNSNNEPIVICRDGRTSSEDLQASMMSGITSCGIDVINIGLLPTPLMNFALKYEKLNNGLMITGSHNPKNYNGVKIVLDGLTLYGDYIQSLKNKMINNEYHVSKKLGKITTDTSISSKYIQFIKSKISFNSSIKIIIDCGNGVTSTIIRSLCSELKINAVIINEDIDGNFPNHPPDPSNPENLKQLYDAINKNSADLGIAFDGDGDRIILMKKNGEIVWPDQLMMIFSQTILKNNPNRSIVYDVKCSQHLENIIRENKGKPIISRTGHSYIKKTIKDHDAILGGEMSGHIFFNDSWFGFDDGMYAMVRLMEIFSKLENIDDVFKNLPKSITTPEISIKYDDNHFTFMEKFVKLSMFSEAKKSEIDGLKLIYDDGWGLIRCSNTSPCLVLRFEANSKKSLLRIQSIFKDAMLEIDDKIQIPF
tara:strand:+ start:1758 stop:3158 length:1401 start_codon:yes stop_codon:yes gene_type:complete